MSRDRAQWLDVAALVARTAPVDFDLVLDGLTRIAPLLAHAGGTARGQFRFHRFAAQEPAAAFDAAEGEVSAKLALTCQRCLDEVELSVAEHCLLAFVGDEAAATNIPPSHDPVVMTQGKVDLVELVEEQLLLGLPLTAMHPNAAECERRMAQQQPAARREDEAKLQPTQRPFAGLRDLMKK